MKILLLGPERTELKDCLNMCGETVFQTEEKIFVTSEILDEVDFIVSYGYRHIIKSEIISQFKKNIINIHISFLPWNRGADPNFWSFLEDTPKGVTIHYLDKEIDAGDILVQKKVRFSQDETLRTSYEKLSQVASDLFKAHWAEIRSGKILAKPQLGDGSYHQSKDKEKYKYLLVNGWDTPISCLIGKAV